MFRRPFGACGRIETVGNLSFCKLSLPTVSFPPRGARRTIHSYALLHLSRSRSGLEVYLAYPVKSTFCTCAEEAAASAGFAPPLALIANAELEELATNTPPGPLYSSVAFVTLPPNVTIATLLYTFVITDPLATVACNQTQTVV